MLLFLLFFLFPYLFLKAQLHCKWSLNLTLSPFSSLFDNYKLADGLWFLSFIISFYFIFLDSYKWPIYAFCWVHCSLIYNYIDTMDWPACAFLFYFITLFYCIILSIYLFFPWIFEGSQLIDLIVLLSTFSKQLLLLVYKHYYFFFFGVANLITADCWWVVFPAYSS